MPGFKSGREKINSTAMFHGERAGIPTNKQKTAWKIKKRPHVRRREKRRWDSIMAGGGPRWGGYAWHPGTPDLRGKTEAQSGEANPHQTRSGPLRSRQPADAARKIPTMHHAENKAQYRIIAFCELISMLT